MKTDIVYCPVCESNGFSRVMTFCYSYSCGDKWTCKHCGAEFITDNSEDKKKEE